MKEDQIALEYWWAELFRSNGATYANKLRESGRASSDSALRRLINQETHNLYRRMTETLLVKYGGQYNDSAKYLLKLMESIEGISLCHLTNSAALNALISDTDMVTLASLGSRVCRSVEIELKIRYIEIVYPSLVKAAERNKATFTHRNRGLLAVAGRASVAGLPTFWSDSDAKQKMEVALTELVLLATQFFEPYKATQGKHLIWCVRVKQNILDTFNRTMALDTLLTTVPNLGLYLSPQPLERKTSDASLLERTPLVTSSWISGRKAPNAPSGVVCGAIARLNCVPYAVNGEMFEWVKRHEKRLGALGLIPQLEFRLTEADKSSKERTAKVYDSWHHGQIKRRAYTKTMIMARKMSQYTSFYHDWFLDFRGRMYTTSRHLSPQGRPLDKALLRFSQSVDIVPGTVAYAEFLDYGLRMVFGKSFIEGLGLRDLADRIERAVNGELTLNDLNDEKDYLPFVAWALDAYKLLTHNHVATGIMVRRDATASSIQHMATMACDTEIMAAVNLSDMPPYPQPKDLYESLKTGLARGPLKAFVMTYCYNSTAYGRAKARVVKEGGRLKERMHEDVRVASLVEPILHRIAAVREWIGDMGEQNNFVYRTPSGMLWDGMKYDWPSKQFKVRTTGATISIRLKTQSGEPNENTRKARAAYVANVVHSLDASMLHLSANDWPPSVAFIHDCVVTLPGQMSATVLALRVAFFKMHKQIHESTNVKQSIDSNVELNYDRYIEQSRYMFV